MSLVPIHRQVPTQPASQRTCKSLQKLPVLAREPLKTRQQQSRNMSRLLQPVFLMTITYLYCFVAESPGQAFEPKQRPNIVLIFIDDMGWKDTGANGSDLYETPNIDALAADGLTFTNAYAAAGNCEPSRACLISGQYTPRHHMYAVGSTNRGPHQKMRVLPIPNINSLPQENYTIANAMSEAGYATGMFGKWHLGKQTPHLPVDQGFQSVDTMNPPSAKIFEQTADPKNISRITNGACDFMEHHRDEPFFVYIAHHATHMGIQAAPATMAKFSSKGPGKQHQNTAFAAMNADMDKSVGRVLQKIKSLGIEDNTIIFFTSDNGGLPQSPQTPLRGFKGMYYEGGIRVPMFVRWPGKIPAGSTSHTPVINIDLYPTFLELASAARSDDKALDGESLVGLVTAATPLKRKSIFWHFPGYLDRANPGARDNEFRTRPVTVIRKGDWKLHLFHEEWSLDGGLNKVATNQSVELYDLSNDIGEHENLAGTASEKRDELISDLLSWSQKVDAKFAQEPNPKYGTPTNEKRKRKRKRQGTTNP